MKKLFVLMMLSASQSFAICLLQEDGGLCPVGPIQINAIKQYKQCKSSSMSTEYAVDQCQNLRVKDVNDPAYEVLGVAGLAALSVKDKEIMIKKFFADAKENMVDEFARLQFDQQFRQGRRIPALDVYRLRREYHALKIQSRGNKVMNEKFLDFQANNAETLDLMRRAYGKKIGPVVEFPDLNADMTQAIYKPNIVNGVDIPNTNWSDLPDNVRVDYDSNVSLKASLRTHGEKVYEALRAEVLQGKTLAGATQSKAFQQFGFSKSYLTKIRQTVKIATFNEQLAVEKRTLMPVVSKKKRIHFDSKNPLHRWGVALGAGALVSGIGYIAMTSFENQRQCEQAFPYTPTSYQASSVPAVDKSMVCVMQQPKADEELPNRTLALLAKTPDEIMGILNGDTGKNSACAYLTEAFNVRFCNVDGAEPASSATETEL